MTNRTDDRARPGVAPFYEECILKAIALALASIAAVATLAGCANSKTPTNKDDSEFVYLLDRQARGRKTRSTRCRRCRRRATCCRSTYRRTRRSFFVDAKSLAVGTDGVVRYAVVITVSAGARNVNYEGIRCDTYEWRQYAGLNSEHDGWDRTVENDWRRIENGELNAYHSALYQDYFCANKMPQADPADPGEHPVSPHRDEPLR